MGKNQRFIALVFAVFFISISCSSEKYFEGQEILFEVSPKIRVYYAETDLSSSYPFPHSTFLDDRFMLSHNMIRNTIDTLYFVMDSLKIKPGIYLESDGPRKVESIINLVKTSESLVLFNGKNLMIDKDGLSDIANYRLMNSPIFNRSIFFGLNQGVSFNLDHFFKGYDRKRECLYFFAEDFQTNEFKMISFDLKTRKFSELPMWADPEKIRKNKVRYEGISKNHMPFIYVNDDRLVISYNYSNEFVIIDLNTKEALEKSYPSELFPLSKTIRIEIPESIELESRNGLMEVLKIMDEWEKDVAFGNFERLPNSKGFFRMIKSPQVKIEEIEQLNLEIFDQSFEKVGEIDLSEIHSDLSSFFFTYKERLFFKAKYQDNENYLCYYFVEINF